MWTMPNNGETGKSVETLRFAEMLSSFAQIPGDVDSAAGRWRAILPAKGEVTDAVRKQYSDLKKKEGAFAGEAGRKNQCYKADDIKLGIRRDCAEPGAINSLIKAIRHKH